MILKNVGKPEGQNADPKKRWHMSVLTFYSMVSIISYRIVSIEKQLLYAKFPPRLSAKQPFMCVCIWLHSKQYITTTWLDNEAFIIYINIDQLCSEI